MAWEHRHRAYPSLEDATSLTLVFGDQVLDSIAFHLNCRGPDSDLFLFPARVNLFHFACFDNNFLSLPTSNCTLECLLTRDTKPPPGSAIFASIEEAVGHLLEGVGTALATSFFSASWMASVPARAMAGPQSFSPASVVETGSFSLFRPAPPTPAGRGAWPRHRAPGA